MYFLANVFGVPSNRAKLSSSPLTLGRPSLALSANDFANCSSSNLVSFLGFRLSGISMLPLGTGEFSAVPGAPPIDDDAAMVAAPANVRLALRPVEEGDVTRKSIGALSFRPGTGEMLASISGFCRLLTLTSSVPSASDSEDSALSTKPAAAPDANASVDAPKAAA